MNEAYAPYNFVPFDDVVMSRYKKAEELPPHDRIDPKLKTGEIHLTLTAETPVFVSDGAAEQPHFFRGADGKYQIPGSTIRGLIRTNVQFLGLGHVRPGEDINASSAMKRGLPQRHQELMKMPVVLDYSHAMFGFISDRKSYASRLSFGDFHVDGNAREGLESRILRGPHTDRCKFYVVDGKSYKSEQYRLRGYKFYWMKAVSGNPVKSGADTDMRPLPAGTRFQGVIRYENLAEDELGLLLWSICLDPGCSQSVGMGKPYGFGRVKPEITGIREYQPEKLYDPAGFFEEPYRTFYGRELSVKVRTYVNCYEAYILAVLAKDCRSTENSKLQYIARIKDFMFLHKAQEKISDNGNEMEYMQGNEMKIRKKPLKTVKEYRQALK